MFASRFARPIALSLTAGTVACAPPRVVALPGVIVPAQHLPTGTLPQGRRIVFFQWEMHDGDVIARGDGAARIASPDSVRLDFFMSGGFGSGAAVLIGDSLQVPGPSMARKLVPPRALLWAALGRFDVPAARDTVARIDGAVLRADIGVPVNWRATFRGDTLTRLDRVDGDRIQEWVARFADQRVQYRNESARRTVSLVIQRSDAVLAPFDPSIWHF